MSVRVWWGKTGVARVSVIIAIVVAGLIAVVAVPRLRAFYFGQGAVSYERTRATLPRLPTPLSRGTAGPTGGPLGRKPVAADSDGRIRVRVSDRTPTRLPAEGIPAGWMAKEF